MSPMPRCVIEDGEVVRSQCSRSKTRTSEEIQLVFLDGLFGGSGCGAIAGAIQINEEGYRYHKLAVDQDNAEGHSVVTSRLCEE